MLVSCANIHYSIAKQDTEAQDSAHGVITEGGAGVIGPTPFGGEVQVCVCVAVVIQALD